MTPNEVEGDTAHRKFLGEVVCLAKALSVIATGGHRGKRKLKTMSCYF